MRRLFRALGVILVGTGVGIGAPAGPASAGDPAMMHEILGILKDNGLVDQAEYERLQARAAAAADTGTSWADRLSFSGDLRLRHESFWYDRDALGMERENRYRARYRFRLAGQAEINELTTVHFRVASGQDDSRSTNQTFGSGVDFDPDGFFMDRAFVELRAPSSWIAKERGEARLRAGKMSNPFRWKVGKDFMLWDSDINPEGVGVDLYAFPADGAKLFLRSGYFVMDEESRDKDPHLLGAQVGGEFQLGSHTKAGVRGSYYAFRSLNPEFLMRGFDGMGGATPGGGNILSDAGVSGLTGDATGQGGIDVGEVGFYVTCGCLDGWPVTLYGDYSRNVSADSVVGLFDDDGDDLTPLVPGRAGKEDTAWGVGLEIGDKTRVAKLGAGYWHVEANAFPSQFIDSDLFDGLTNREGWAFYGSRRVLGNVDLNMTLFWSDEIETGPAFTESVGDADRLRLQTDLVLQF